MIGKVTTLFALALLSAPSGIYAQAPAPAVGRAELQRFPVPGSNYDVVTTTTDLAPGAVVPSHTHYGMEINYIIAGTATLSVNGRPDRVVKAGDSFSVPALVPHGARNESSEPCKILATFVVERNKPFRTFVK